MTYLVLMLLATDGSGILSVETTPFDSPQACLTAVQTIEVAPQDKRLGLQLLGYCVSKETGERVDG